MKRFEIRTKDQILKRALECWWTEAEPRLPEATVVVSDRSGLRPPLGRGGDHPFPYPALQSAPPL